jgi:hypothetical protein
MMRRICGTNRCREYDAGTEKNVIILMFIPSKTYIEKLINLRKNIQQMGS